MTDCAHLERIDGRCVACGDCEHDVILNGACVRCGTTELDPVKLSPKPPAAIVPADRLRKRTP